MELLKLIKNRISTEWKKTFNDNVDIMNGITRDQNKKIDVVDKRIDNLVLHSGGDSPNEVIDARVNNKGEMFDTLETRLIKTENDHDQKMSNANNNIENTKEQLDKLNNIIQTLYKNSGSSLSIYVSINRGNDVTADGTEEKPFKTIQSAVNVIPLLNSSSITIFVDEGVYLEDVVFSGIISPKIILRSVQSVTTDDVYKTNLPVKVRSVSFMNCNANMRLYGFSFVDQKNVSTASPISIQIVDNGMLTVDSCACNENVKTLEIHRSVYSSGNSKVHVKGCFFENQKNVFYVDTASEIRVGGFNKGSNNEIVNCAENGTIRTNSGVTGSNVNQTVGVGLIITKGTVLS